MAVSERFDPGSLAFFSCQGPVAAGDLIEIMSTSGAVRKAVRRSLVIIGVAAYSVPAVGVLGVYLSGRVYMNRYSGTTPAPGAFLVAAGNLDSGYVRSVGTAASRAVIGIALNSNAQGYVRWMHRYA